MDEEVHPGRERAAGGGGGFGVFGVGFEQVQGALLDGEQALGGAGGIVDDAPDRGAVELGSRAALDVDGFGPVAQRKGS